jgi:hypothetical protein
MLGKTGKKLHQSPPLEEGQVIYRTRVKGKNGKGEPIVTCSQRQVKEIDEDENRVRIGPCRFALAGITQQVNDPSVDRWSRDKPGIIPDGKRGATQALPGFSHRVPKPKTPKQLCWMPQGGKNSRGEVNDFLEGGPDGRVDHKLGAVNKWKIAFFGSYCGSPLSVVVVGPPYNPGQNDEGIATITRIANHPHAPKNTSSWMIARTREWAKSRGYNAIVTYSGVAGNRGVCYDAAGFEKVGEVQADGGGWENRDGRDDIRDGEEWSRTKWRYGL